MKILVVDDEREFVEVLTAAFQVYRPGYTIIAAHTGREALAKAEMETPDLVVLDVMLPDIDGLEVCRRLRATGENPILLLTAKAAEQDMAQGFEAGANDYVTKPFKYPTLMARVDGLLVRSKALPSTERPALLEWGDLVVDFAQGRVRVRGRDVDLTAQEYRILEELARDPGQVVSHEILLSRVWVDEHHHDPQHLRVCVYRLRRKIEADPQRPRHIITHHSEGYRLAKGNDAPEHEDARHPH